ncbi:F-box domain [Macleaya cordata]|uniref:F-box domain n=1 Tax=Macleaya cordata TaxID=56857 RepID=A0A200PP67_MACCD|nr:F-box domain [Macleaya cordata]
MEMNTRNESTRGSGVQNEDDYIIGIPSCPSTSSRFLDDKVVCDILSRLPVKTLMLFKCVCKQWRSLIQQDPYLIDSHVTRSEKYPGDTNILFIYSQPIKEADHVGTTFTFAYWFECGGLVNRWKLDLDCTHVKILKPINGLICLCRYDDDSVLIYNPSTGQRTSWIQSTISSEEIGVRKVACYFEFGYDPTTKEHKVICIWGIFKRKTSPDFTADYEEVAAAATALLSCDDYEEIEDDQYFCEVLTVGENRWRRIDVEVPLYLRGYSIYTDSIYANGYIYWRYHSMYNSKEEVLVAFDVGREKFIVIQIPDSVIDPEIYKWSQTVELLEVDERKAVLDWITSFVESLVPVQKHHHHHTRSASTAVGN